MSERTAQSGFIVMIMLVVMVIGAAAFFVSTSSNIAWERESQEQLDKLKKLKEIKQRLLSFAVLFPEIYFKDGTSPYDPIDFRSLGGPGYLPCPYDRSNGRMSTDCQAYSVDPDSNSVTTNIIQGFLPPFNAQARRFYFDGGLAGQGDYLVAPTQNEALVGRSYILIMDERFAFQNAKYNSGGTIQPKRAAPLNSDFDDTNFPYPADHVDLSNNPPLHAPVLQLNDDGNSYVALIVDPGAAQQFPGFNQANSRPAPATPPADPDTYLQGYLDRRYDTDGNEVDGNANGDFTFYSAGNGNVGVNDQIVGITYEEWVGAIRGRLCADEDFYNSADGGLIVWFNNYDSVVNPAGSGWKDIVAGGLCDE